MNDLISRERAIEAIVNTVSDVGNRDNSETASQRYGAAFRQLEIIDILQALPSAEPVQKKGKWVNANEDKWNTVEVLKCSACGEMDNRMYRTDSYCPNCGAKMGEE